MGFAFALEKVCRQVNKMEICHRKLERCLISYSRLRWELVFSLMFVCVV